MSRASATGQPVVSAPVLGTWQGRLREAIWALGVGLISFGVALLLYQVWRQNLHLPLGYSYDVRFVASWVKGLDQNGWWIWNPRLGAPFTQDMRDFPRGGQSLNLVGIRLIAGVVHSPGLTINLFYLGGFALLAAVSFGVFRALGLSRPIAAGLAIAYDFLPWHLWHGPDHLSHSTYWTAPLAVLLIVRALEPQRRFLRDPDAPVHRPYFGPNGSIRGRPLVLLLVIAVLIGSSSEMISTFTVVMLVISGVLAAIATRRISRLLFALLFAAGIIGAFVLVSLPTLVHVLLNGKDQVAARRFAFESDLYGLRIGFMMLPTPQHWIHGMGTWARRLLLKNSMPSEGGQSVGTIGVIGVLAAIAVIVPSALRPAPGTDAKPRRPLPPVIAPLALVVVLGVALGAGGATFLDTLSGFTQIRTWNWIVLIIAFAAFALTGFGCEWLLDAVRARTTRRGVIQAVTIGLALVIAGLGILDGGRPPLPNGKAITAEWVSDQAFVAAMHTVQPDNGMIFQFPVVRFPEALPVVKMKDYAQIRGYLADKGHFHWSYGAVKGRPKADWQLKVPQVPDEADLRALVGMGFTGIWENRDGYADGGKAFEARMNPRLGAALVSQDGKLVFWDLRPFASKIEPGADLAAEAKARFGITPPPRHPQ